MLASRFLKSPGKEHAGKAPLWVVVVGDKCLDEQGVATIGERLKRYRVRGGRHGFHGIANCPLQIAGEFLQLDEGIR